MSNQVRINPSGGQVSWSITVDGSMVALYQAVLLDANSTVVQQWTDQRTTDGAINGLTIPLPVAQLAGHTLAWQALVSDPTSRGGSYTGSVQIRQDGEVIGTASAQGTVPPGAGQMAPFTGELGLSV